MLDLIRAFSHNTFVENVQLVNTGINTEGGKELGNLLRSNTSITNLNIETNKIGPEGVHAIADALAENKTLKEIRLTNQHQQMGFAVETHLMKCVEQNSTLVKCTASLNQQNVRNGIDRQVSRNKEEARKARMAAKHG